MKKILLLALCLLLMLQFGCTATTTPPTEDNAPTTEAVPADKPAETPVEPTEEPAEEPIEEPAEPSEEPAEPVETPDVHPTGVSAELYYNPEHPYWVDDEMQTISFSINYNSGINSIVTPNDSLMIDELEAITNVHVEWEIISNFETYSIMLTSGDYADLISPMGVYPGGWIKAEDDGIIQDVTEIMADCMPNYSSLVFAKEAIRRDTIADDGNFKVFYNLVCGDDGETKPADAPWGMLVRKDWLDDMGMELPVTIADWETVLTAFRDEKGAAAPLFLMGNGFANGDCFLTAYGVQNAFFIDPTDGQTIKYGPMEDGYRQYIEMMRDWYDRGLIYRDFVSDGTFDTFLKSLATGVTGASSFASNQSDNWFYKVGMSDDEDFCLYGVEPPVLNEGDTSYFNGYRSYTWNPILLSSTCENVAAAARWFDYFYTHEGMLLTNYGVENEGYYLDENGMPQFTEACLARPEDAITATNSLPIYSLGPHIGLMDVDTYSKDMTPIMRRNMELNNSISFAMAMSTEIALSMEESEVISGAYSDISTYVSEMTCRFITGTTPLDEYDAFVESIADMGIEDCIEAYQAAYTRYINR